MRTGSQRGPGGQWPSPSSLLPTPPFSTFTGFVGLLAFFAIRESDLLPLRVQFLSWVPGPQSVSCVSFKGGRKLSGTD